MSLAREKYLCHFCILNWVDQDGLFRPRVIPVWRGFGGPLDQNYDTSDQTSSETNEISLTVRTIVVRRTSEQV